MRWAGMSVPWPEVKVEMTTFEIERLIGMCDYALDKQKNLDPSDVRVRAELVGILKRAKEGAVT